MDLIVRSAYPILAMMLLSGVSLADERRPNVVMILADDCSYQDFGFMGNQLVHTPNIDRLAAASARFPNGYVPMSVCRPSLATLLTGLYPHQHGIHFNHPPPGLSTMRKMPAAEYLSTRHTSDYLIQNVATLPSILAANDYSCLQTGKHWESDFRTAGFTHGMTRGIPAARLGPVTGTREQANGEWVAHGNGDAGLVIGRETMQPIDDFLSDVNASPFFIWYAPFLPHTPFDAPQEFHDLYKGKVIPDSLLPYYAEIARFDATVGQLLAMLKHRKLLQNTLVVFLSDNGFRPDKKRPGRHDQRSKLSFYEDGIRTPILFHWPKKIKAAEYSQLVSSVDIVPTVLSAVGLEDRATSRMQGRSLMQACCGEGQIKDEPVFGAVYPNDARTLGQPSRHVKARWIRDGNFKLVLAKHDKATLENLLYDLKNDPFEKNNLYSAPDCQQTIQSLSRQLNNWWTGQSDLAVTPKI